MRIRWLLFLLVFTLASGILSAQTEAPTLASSGRYEASVRTLTFVNEGVPDVPAIRTIPDAMTDRALLVDVWFPAQDDTPVIEDGPYPLIVMSHGLNGDRVQMAYLAEHLATYGYVVASIDHEDPASLFLSLPAATFYRPLDIRFVLDEIEKRANRDDDPLFSGLVDAARTGVIGYSYGGYGALVVGGAGLTEAVVMDSILSPQDVVGRYSEASIAADERIRAIFTFAPFGGDLTGLNGIPSAWSAEALSGITAPMFVMAGDEDEVSQYITGIVPIFEGAINSERYLLTVPGVGHMVAQRNAAVAPSEPFTVSINDAAQHFAVAFFGTYLEEDTSYSAYLDLSESGADWFGWPDAQVDNFVFRAQKAQE